MEYRLNARRERHKIGRLATTLLALCLPILAATFFSGSIFKLGTLQPGQILDVNEAHASGHSSMQHADPNAIPAGAIVVSLTSNGFVPSTVSVRPGSTVAWVNRSNAEAAIQITSPVVFGSAPLKAGETFIYVFGRNGTFPFKNSTGTSAGTIVVDGVQSGETETGTTTPGSTTTAGTTGTVQATGTTTPGGTTTAGATGTTQPGCSATGNVSVSINNSFSPSSISVGPGTQVTWTNNGSSRARVRDINHVLFDSGDLSQGQSWSYIFCNSGSYPYENARTNDTGVVNVSGTPGPTGTTTPGSTTTAGTTTPGATGTAQTTSTPPAGVVNIYAMSHDVFSPNDVTITTGTTVRWTNADEEDHTSTSDTAVWNSGVLHAGQSFDFTFLQPGTYHYTCLIHGAEMQGFVRVTGNGITPTPGGTGTPEPTVVAGTLDVSVQNFAFQPSNVTILVGTTVRWTNRDSSAHTSTSDTGLWNSGDLGLNGQFSYVFNTPGTYAYHCDRHTGMRGTITVVSSMPTGTPQATSTAQPSTTGTAQATTTAQSTATAQPTGTSVPQTVDVAIQNYAYNPTTITVQAGTTVRWTNMDPDNHSVTSSTGLFDSGPFPQGGQWQYTFNTPGTYEYYCTVHGTFMTSYVVVQAGSTATPQTTTTAQPSATGTARATTTAQSTATAQPSGTTTPQTCQISFTDVQPGSTFYEFVQCLACHNVLGGYTDGTFRPNNSVTRGQLAKIVANAASFNETPAGQTFEDVAPGSTFYLFVERMAARGIINGYACGGTGEPCGRGSKPYFRTNNSATRGQITKIISNAKGYNDTPAGQTFADVATNDTFYIYVERLAMRGTMNGYTCGGANEPCDPAGRPYFRPGNNATRGQVSKIVRNTFFPNCAVQ